MKANATSLQTCSHDIRGIKQFSRWLKLQKRTPDDPLAALTGFNVDTDRRYVRREMLPEEVAYLLPVVESYTTAMHNLPGPDRAMAYRVALGTGFRAKEPRSLTPSSFNLDCTPPTPVVVPIRFGRTPLRRHARANRPDATGGSSTSTQQGTRTFPRSLRAVPPSR
jgi:integrase